MPAIVRSYQEKKDNPKYKAIAESFAQRHGIKPEDVIFVKDFDDKGNPTSDVEVRQRTSILGSMGAEFAAGIAPTIGAAGIGVGTGAITTVATGNPLVGAGVGLTTGVASGFGLDMLERKALKTYVPKIARELEIANQSHPGWSIFGGVASGGVAQRNLPRHLAKALPALRGGLKSFGEKIAADPVLREVIPAGQKFTTALAINALTAVGVGAGGDIAMQAANAAMTPGEQGIDLWRAAKVGAAAPLFGGGAPRFGRKLAMAPANMLAARQAKVAAAGTPPLVPPQKTHVETAKAYWDAYQKADDAGKAQLATEMWEKHQWKPEQLAKYTEAVTAQEAETAKPTAEQEREDALNKGQIEDPRVDQDMVKWLVANKRLNVKGEQVRMVTKEAEKFLQTEAAEPFKAAYRTAKEAEAAAKTPTLPPETPAEPTALTPTRIPGTGEPNAIPKPSPETLPPSEASKTSPEMGEGVPSKTEPPREEGGAAVPPPKIEVTPEIISEAERIVGERLVYLPPEKAKALWEEHGGGLFKKLSQTDKAKWMDEGGKLAPDTIWNYFEELIKTKSGAFKRGDNQKLVGDPDGKIAEKVAAGKELPPPEMETGSFGGHTRIPDWLREEMLRRGLKPGRTFNDIDLGNKSVREAIELDPTLTREQKDALLVSGTLPERPSPLPEIPRGPEFNPIKNPAHKAFEGTLKQLGETEGSYSRKIEDSPWVPDESGVPVKQGTSAIEGHGNFVTEDLQAGAEIAPAFVPSKTNPKEFVRTAAGRFTNHSDSPNARIENIYGPDGVRSVLTANRALKAGEELTIDYPSAAKMIEELDNFLKTETIPLKSKAGRKVIPPKKSAAAKPLEVPREPAVERPQDIPAADRQVSLEAAWDAANAYKEDLAKGGQEVSPLSIAAEKAITAATKRLPDKEAFHIANLFTKHLKAGETKDKAVADVLRYLKSAEKRTASKEGQLVKKPVKKARKPITGETGALGAWRDAARATHNVAQDIITSAKKAGNKIGEVLQDINKGFEEASNQPKVPSILNTKKGGELYSFPAHLVFSKMSQAIGKLVGKTCMVGTEYLAKGAGENLRSNHPVEGNYVMDNTVPTFQMEQRKMFNEFLSPLYEAGQLKLSRAQWEKIGRYSIDMDEYKASPIALTAAEEKGYNYTRRAYDFAKLAQKADGPDYSGRAAWLIEYFYPNSVMSEKVRKILASTDRADAAERKRLLDLQAAWHKTQDPKATQEDINAHMAAVLGKEAFAGTRNPTFAPLIKSEGVGLHPELREINAFKTAQFYAMRSATGLAWYRAVQKDPIAARIFGVTDNGRGKRYAAPGAELDVFKKKGTEDIGDFDPSVYEITDYGDGPKYAANLAGDYNLEYFRSEMGLGNRRQYDFVDRMTALVNSAKLGPKTVLRDVLASLPIATETATTAEIAKYWGPAMQKVILGESEATKVGAVRAKDTAEMAIDNTIRNTMGKITDVMRKYQGRDLFERGIREVLYEFYHSVADARLKKGDIEFLEAWGGKQWKKYPTDALLQRMATRLMENVQGSYTGEFLPAAVGKGAAPNFLKTTFSLSRWNIERMRRYRQTVLKPLAEKGDWKPFLRSSLMHQLFAAPVITAIEQFVTGLKPQNLTWAEWLGLADDKGRPDDNKMDELAYTILANAQLTGLGGMLSGLAMDAYRLKHGESVFGFGNPFWASAHDMVGRIVHYWGTHSGPELLLAPFQIPLETLMQEIQTARLIRNRVNKVEETGMREEKIWKRMTGQTEPSVKSFMRPNPWDPRKKIARAETPEDVKKQVPRLFEQYRRYTPSGPTRFAKRERPEDFYRFMSAAQGTPAAADQYIGDQRYDAMNKLRDFAAEAAWTTAVESKTPLERAQFNRRVSR